MGIILKIIMKSLNKNNSYLITIFLFSFFINFYVANKGVFPIDTFLHYDSASRILNGLIPVRDYWIVHGLTLDYIQLIFFSILGVNWVSYIIHSSLFNSFISILTFILLNQYGLKKIYSFFLTISFATLAYTISGTPFIDQHAIFLSFLGFYLFYFGINKDLKYLFFIPLTFILAFFSKPVPTIYFISLIICVIAFTFYKTKNYKILIYPFFGSIVFSILLLLFILFQGIDLKLFFTQLIFYPISFGSERFFNSEFQIEKILTNYKYILAPLFLSFFLMKKWFKKIKFNYTFIVLLLINFACIYHQLFTKNQNFIFFLIPINLAFLIIIIEKNVKKKKLMKILIFLSFLFCLLTTFKYHYRFNIERKFHDLQMTNLEKNLPAKKIHHSLNFLKWKTRKYDDPQVEIELVKKIIKDIEGNKSNLILMTNYNFISSIINKKIFTISRTYDDLSFPDKENIFYDEFKEYFYNLIRSRKISQIYIFSSTKSIENDLNRYIFEYFDKNCIQILEKNKNFAKIELKEDICNFK